MMDTKILKLKNIALVIFAVLAIGGCVKDDGNYNYRELPALEINGFVVRSNGSDVTIGEDNTIFISKNARVEIEPAYDISGELTPKYEWILYPNPNTDKVPGEIISTEPELKRQFAEKPGKYNLVLRLVSPTEPNDFNNYLMIALTIESVNGVGILHRGTSGMGEISIFKSAETDLTLSGSDVIFEKEVYSNANGGNIFNPVCFAFDYDAINRFHLASEAGVKYLDVEMIDSKAEMSEIFYTADDIPSTITSGCMATSLNKKFSFMVANGKLYGRTNNSYYENSDQYVKLSEDDYTNIIVMNDDEFAGHVIFNETYKRFERLQEGAGGFMWGMDLLKRPAQINSTGGEVDIADTKLDIVEYGKASSTLNTVMKDVDGYYVVGFTFPAEGTESECLYKNDITSLEGVGESSVWEIGRKGDYIFYSNGNKLYTYTIAANTSAEQKLGLSDGETIVKLELFKDNSGTNISNDGAVLFVVTQNGNNYSLHQYTINPLTGKVDNMSGKSVSGLGEVMDIVHIAR